MPLHGGQLRHDGPEQFACQGDHLFEGVAFDWRCDDCLERAIGYADAGHAEDEMLWVPANGDEPRRVTLAWNIERAVQARRAK